MSATEPKDLTMDDAKALIKDLEKEVAELTKQLDEHSPESIYSINVPPVTIRARPGEPLARFTFRASEAIKQFTAAGIIKPNGNGHVEPVQPQTTVTPQATTPTQPQSASQLPMSDNVMPITKLAIVSDRSGMPQLELYQNGHKFPDLRYSLGKEMEARKANIAKMLGWNTADVQIGIERNVNARALWAVGRDPKYKDLVSLSFA